MASLRSLLSIRLLRNLLCYILSPSFCSSSEKTSFKAPTPSQNTIVTHQLCQKMLSTLAGLSVIAVIAQKAAELHRFHSSILSRWWLFDSTRWAAVQTHEARGTDEIWVAVLHGQHSCVCVWMWQREEGYEISWVSVVREVWNGKGRFPIT